MKKIDDVVLNKSAIVERCLARIKEEYTACPELDNFTHLDAIILNLERACQATIDMAMHLLARDHYGIPQGSSDAFRLLAQHRVIDEHLSIVLQKMVGFRNIAVHEYQGLEIEVVKHILENCLDDFTRFCRKLGVVIR